ncbi:Zn(II)2Cys6 transcription factor [Aspergillus alliaceus]|uniref:Zn(II)2Cys6 transcription factor n=1 Tax=Petromyces alliaceus TaxID=209559 RepID=UPI0012A4FB3E|nr:fungal-specific transcription factor domain-containing protein [Aspergillus alliaceus]KAB8237155.1 fungal-specific transcription factor domain-containing protein [Aspergillus alliaceus]
MASDSRRNASNQRGKYTARACEECRRRRAKCDGKKPGCSRCLQWHIPCQYSVAEDGRRPASKTYVLLLRQRIESLERLLERHGIDAREPPTPVQQPLNRKVNGSIQPDDISSDIDDLAEGFKGRLALDESLNFDQDGEMRYFGPTSGRLQFQSSTSSNGVSVNGSSFSVSPPDQVSDSFGYIDPIDPVTAGLGVPKDVQNHLIDLYFKWEQPWYAIVDEDLFRESMNSGGRYWTPLLHNCILALGSRYSDRVDVRLDPDDPNTAGKMFLEEAKPQLHREMESPSLTTIQALGLIGMVYIAMGADAAGWLHHGMANRLSLDMGLNLDPAGFEEANTLPQREIQLRRQIYWTLYCHDKLSSSYTGRICSMLDSQGAVKMPDDDPVIDTEISPTQKAFRLLQRAMISVCRIQERITLSLWAPKPLLKDYQRPAFLKSCLLDLRSWFYDLPKELRVDRANEIPQAYTLHMVYHTARILLAKPFIMKGTIPSKTKDETTELAHSICRESARLICLVAQKYRHNFGGYHRSPITATHCTLSAALVLLDETENLNAPSHKHKLALCLTVLDELSKSWYPAGHIGHNLRKLCRSEISDESFSLENGLYPFEASPSPPLDMGAELPNVIDESESNPSVNPRNALANQLEFSVPIGSLPVDYGFFDILNQINWGRMW